MIVIPVRWDATTERRVVTMKRSTLTRCRIRWIRRASMSVICTPLVISLLAKHRKRSCNIPQHVHVQFTPVIVVSVEAWSPQREAIKLSARFARARAHNKIIATRGDEGDEEAKTLTVAHEDRTQTPYKYTDALK